MSVGVYECGMGAISQHSMCANFINLMFPTHSCVCINMSYVDLSQFDILVCAIRLDTVRDV